MDLLKGPGKVVATIYTQRNKACLLSYADGSHGITRDGRAVGVWEPHETDECMRIFAAGIAQTSQRDVVILLRPNRQGEAQPALSMVSAAGEWN